MSEHRAGVTPSWLTAKARRYLYRVSIGAIAVAVGYGLITDEQGLLWLGLAAPVLAIADDNVA